MGRFNANQPLYAAAGLATFPVNVAGPHKKPAVRGYLNVGLERSRKLAERFGESEAFGFALGRKSGLTVLDCDSSNDRVLADALDRHGQTPVVVRSGRGHYQAWYRHNGERRHIRPFPGLPIDVLGGGYVVAPPSLGTMNEYKFIAGKLDDLDRLPLMENGPPAPEHVLSLLRTTKRTAVGKRNDTLFRLCLQDARACDDLDTLIDAAITHNDTFHVPLEAEEVVRTARSAWGYEERGQNWAAGWGRRPRSAEIYQLGMDAHALLLILRDHHFGRGAFVVANAMADTMPGEGWRRQRFAAARSTLEASGRIVLLRPASRTGGPPLYRWPDVQGWPILPTNKNNNTSPSL